MMDKTRFFRRRFCRSLLATAWARRACLAAADGSDARAVVEQFLQTQTAGLPGQARIQVTLPASGALPPCEALEAFLPTGRRALGPGLGRPALPGEQAVDALRAGARRLEGRYLVAARAIDAGQALGAGDVAERTGDLTAPCRTRS